MVDVKHQISSVERGLGRRELPAGEARVLTMSQTYQDSIEDVWDAVTNIERIPRWLMPITGDLRLGGRYQLEGNAGGTIERCDPPNSFAATWEFGGQVSWIEVRLTAEAGGTRLELEHVAHVDENLWVQFGPGAVGIGWDSMFLGLALYTATGEGMDPEAAAAWVMSDEGREFMTLSSDAWRQANIDAGQDEETAKGSAERVLAAYTGAPEG